MKLRILFISLAIISLFSACGSVDAPQTWRPVELAFNSAHDYSATGADGYRWLESEMVQSLGKEKDIDRSYYDELVNAAIYGSGTGKDRKPGISDFCDFEWFVSDDPIPTPKLDTPPWLVACGKETCEGCENFHNDAFHMECRLGYDIGDMLVFNDRDIELENFKKR